MLPSMTGHLYFSNIHLIINSTDFSMLPSTSSPLFPHPATPIPISTCRLSSRTIPPCSPFSIRKCSLRLQQPSHPEPPLPIFPSSHRSHSSRPMDWLSVVLLETRSHKYAYWTSFQFFCPIKTVSNNTTHIEHYNCAVTFTNILYSYSFGWSLLIDNFIYEVVSPLVVFPVTGWLPHPYTFQDSRSSLLTLW